MLLRGLALKVHAAIVIRRADEDKATAPLIRVTCVRVAMSLRIVLYLRFMRRKMLIE